MTGKINNKSEAEAIWSYRQGGQARPQAETGPRTFMYGENKSISISEAEG